MPEYLLMHTDDRSAETVKVSALIDGKAGMVSDILVRRETLVRIFDQFLNETLKYMSFDEHPKRLVGISIAARRSGLHAQIKAKSLTRDEQHALR